MLNNQSYRTWGEYSKNPFIQRIDRGLDLSLRGGLYNNDDLLRATKTYFSDQLRYFESAGVKIQRRNYSKRRRGQEYVLNIKYICYFHQYWVDRGLTRDVIDFINTDLITRLSKRELAVIKKNKLIDPLKVYPVGW